VVHFHNTLLKQNLRSFEHPANWVCFLYSCIVDRGEWFVNHGEWFVDRESWFLKEGFVVFVQRYKYMYICLWTALRTVVFERGLCGF